MDVYQGCKSILQSSGPIISKCVPLKSGACMPIIGFGTYQIRGSQSVHNSIDAALANGYRLIDTAAVYGNHVQIAEALKVLLPKYKLRREDIFITSKLSPSDHGENVNKAVARCINELQVSYLDLFLIHWPGASSVDVDSPKNAELRSKSWSELEKLHDKGNGVLKSIGVSNYTAKHLDELLKSCSVTPAVNQVEFHPHYQQTPALYDVCEKNNIILQAYSSLGGGRNTYLIEDSVVVSVANKLNKTPAQVLLRWGLQCGYAIIPKSQNSVRIRENCLLDFGLSDEDFTAIKSIKVKKKYAWDPQAVF